MLDATPPECYPGSSYQFAQTAANTSTSRVGFVRSLLSVVGVVFSSLATLWTFNNPNLGGVNSLLALSASGR